MTAQEAYERLQAHYVFIAEGVFDSYEITDKLFEAIGKQIPKKPKRIDEYYENGQWVQEYECPSCGNPYVDDSYCGTCGQALDWGE